jgi:hypothetical protein
MKALFATAVPAAALALAACSQAEAQGGAPDPAPQEMLDRIAIEDMAVAYYAHLGGGEASEFGQYFTEDAVFDVNGEVARGREEIEGLYSGMSEDGSSPGEAGTFHMLLSNPLIEVNGNEATAQFVWTGVLNSEIGEPPRLLEQGREYDRLVKRDGKWLFIHRVVIADSGLPDRFRETYSPRRDFTWDE